MNNIVVNVINNGFFFNNPEVNKAFFRLENNEAEEKDITTLSAFDNGHLVEDLSLLTPNDRGFIDGFFTERLRVLFPT